MKILIGGGSGFVGQALNSYLSAKGHKIEIISRQNRPGYRTWDDVKDRGIEGYDAVINLAGFSILKRWSPKNQEKIIDSRLKSSELLVNKIIEATLPPKVWISASAIGWYPHGSHLTFDEKAPHPGKGFLSHVCQLWEKAATLPMDCPTRSCIIRLSLVLGKNGGVLAKMVPSFRWGLGAIMGSGKEGFPWIHIEDLCRLFEFTLDNDSVNGILNGVSPQRITSSEFAYALGRTVKKPVCLKFPPFLIKLLFGQQASLFLDTPFVYPQRPLEYGFQYYYPAIDAALSEILKNKKD